MLTKVIDSSELTTDQPYPAIDRVLKILRERLHVSNTSSDHLKSLESGDVHIDRARLCDDESSIDITMNGSNNNISVFPYHEICSTHDVKVVGVGSGNSIHIDIDNADHSNCVPSKLALIAMQTISMEDLRCRDRSKTRMNHCRDRSNVLGYMLILQRCFDGILWYNQYYRELRRRYLRSLRRLWDEEAVLSRFNRSMKSNCIRRLGKLRLATLYDNFRYNIRC